MTEQTPLEQAREKRIQQLVETLTRIVDWESVSAADNFSEAAYTHVEAFLNDAPSTPEPARLSAEALPQRGPMELADALDVRAGYLSGQSWELPATQAMMREAATMLRALAAPPQGTEK